MTGNVSQGGRNAVVLLACAVLAGGLIGVATILFRSGGDTSTAPGDGEPSATHWQPQPGDVSAQPSPDSEVPAAAEDAAGEAVVLFTEYGYEDSSPDEWAKRLAKVSTDSYAKYLKDRYVGLEKAQQDWDRFVVPDREAYRTVVSNVELETSGLFTNDDTSLTFTVTYRTSMRSKATGGVWTKPTSDLRKLVTVHAVGDAWLVNDVRSVADTGEEPAGTGEEPEVL